MKRNILFLLILTICFYSNAQQYTPSPSWGNSFKRLAITQADTVGTKISGSLTVIGGTLYIADGTKWSQVSGGTSNLRFTSNVVVNGGTGTKVGIWNEGETIPLAGKLYDSLPYILATKCNHPSYVTPTATISASPSSGSYERGTNLGTITLSSVSGTAINNGGAFTTTTYYQNGGALGGNTTTISSLTSANTFYVNKAYTQGACIVDNCGTIDCTGRINAGSVNSSTISFTPFDKRYWGFVNTTTPSNAEILALTQDNNGATGNLTLSNVTPSGSQYLAYFTKGSVSSVTVNGIPATGAFTFTTFSVTNAQGYASTYTYVYSNNPQTSTLSSVIFN